MCYVKFQNILINVLVHLLSPLSFRLRCPGLLLSKLWFIIKVSTICGAGQDTINLCHKFNSQGLDLGILGFRVTCPKFQEHSVRVPCPRVPVPESWVSWYRVPGPKVPRSQVSGSRVSESWVSGPDFRLCRFKGVGHFYFFMPLVMSI